MIATKTIRIKKGLDIPLAGKVVDTTIITHVPKVVGLVGEDTHNLRPTIFVSEGDVVQKGTPLYENKRNPGFAFVSPVAGTVRAVHRGEKRLFKSIEIEVSAENSQVVLPEVNKTTAEGCKTLLVASGLWTQIRTRPYGLNPALEAQPAAIFVTAIDTDPIPLDYSLVVAGKTAEFAKGLEVLALLTAGKVFVCASPSLDLPVQTESANITRVDFSGLHPAGLVGTHIHYLRPVSHNLQVWYLDMQDVVAIGTLFLHGKIDTTRLIAVGGPAVAHPRYVRTTIGASLSELLQRMGEPQALQGRVVSGSVLSGRKAEEPCFYLGKHHRQVVAIQEGTQREFMGWLSPGMHKFSNLNIYVSSLFPPKTIPFTTSSNGSDRAIVPLDTYERVMPLDILAAPLLRYLVVGDVEMAEKLGALELEEEDVSLCSFVCPAKYEYPYLLRKNLESILQDK